MIGLYAFAVIYAMWYFLELIDQVYITMQHKESKILIRNDRLSMLGLVAGSVMIVSLAFAFGIARANSGFAALPQFFFYIGISMMVLGEIIRQTSIRTLGKSFTAAVIIVEGQRLVRKGMYKHVRHPGYLGGIISMVGIGFAMQSWAAVLAALLIVASVYMSRIYLEEEALRKHFGPEYDDYARKTSMLLPHVL